MNPLFRVCFPVALIISPLAAWENLVVREGQIVDYSKEEESTIGLSALSGKGVIILGDKNLFIQNDTDLVYSGEIVGRGGVAKSGKPILVLYGESSYRGPTVVREGSIAIRSTENLGDPDALLVLQQGSLHIHQEIDNFCKPVLLQDVGIIHNFASVTMTEDLLGDSLIKKGQAKLKLAGEKSYSGNTCVDEGTLVIDGMGSLGTATSPVRFENQSGLEIAEPHCRITRPIRLAAGTHFSLNTPHDTVLEAPISTEGKSSFTKLGKGALILESKFLHQDTFHLQEGSFVFKQGNALEGCFFVKVDGVLDGSALQTPFVVRNLCGEGTICLSDESMTVINQKSTSFTGRILGKGSLEKKGQGTFHLAESQEYTGSTRISEGSLVLFNRGSLADSCEVIVDGTLDISKVFESALINNVSGKGIIQIGHKDLLLRQSDSSTFFGSFVDGGLKGNLTKLGSGKLTLVGDSDYSGITFIQEGTLEIFSEKALGNSSCITFLQSSALEIGPQVSQMSIPICIEKDAVATIHLPCGIVPFSSQISGEGQQWKKTGKGILEISNVTSFVQSVHVAEGTLRLSKNGSISHSNAVQVDGCLEASTTEAPLVFLKNLSGSGQIDLGDKALVVEQSVPTVYAGSVQSLGGLTKLGKSDFCISSPQNYVGKTDIAEGTLRLKQNGSVERSSSVKVVGALDISEVAFSSRIRNVSGKGDLILGEKCLYIEQEQSQLFSGSFYGKGTLCKEGSGTLLLRGSNGHEGHTIVSDGSLVLLEKTHWKGSSLTLVDSGVFNFEGIYAPSVEVGVLKSRSFDSLVQMGNKQLIVNNPQDSVFSGSFSGVGGSVSKKGSGRLTLNGFNPWRGIFYVEEGELNIAAPFLSTIYVRKGASLTGKGKVGSVVNEGRIAAGSPIGTWQVDGHFILRKGSLLAVDIDGQRHNDRFVVSGDAELGGTLSVNFLSNGVYFPGMKYPLIHAKNISGAFDEIIDSSAEYDIEVEYPNKETPSEVHLVVVKAPQVFRGLSFASQGTAVAKNLSALAEDGAFFQESSSELTAMVQSFSFLNEQEIASALDQMHSASFSALTESAAQTAFTLSELFRGRAPPRCCIGRAQKNKGSIWFEPFAQQYDQPTLDGQIPFDSVSYGGALGWEVGVGETGVLGLGFVAEHTHLDWKQQGGHAEMTNLYPAIYGGASGLGGYFNAVFLYGFDEITTKRNVFSAQSVQTATGTRNGSEYIGSVEGGLLLGNCGFFVPYFSVTYDQLHQQSCTETGAGALSLQVDAQTGGTLFSEVGCAFRPMSNYVWGCMGMEFFGSAIFELPVDRQAFTNSFAPFTNTFTVDGYNANQWFGNLGGSFFLRKRDYFVTQISYEAIFNTTLLVQKGMLEFKFHY